MHTYFAVLAVTLFIAFPAWPQSNAPYSALQDARRALEIQMNQSGSPTPEQTSREAAVLEARMFEVHMTDFARAWNDFVQEYSDKHIYNLKKARSLSRALKKLQAHLPQ
jgi:hypothetical protein